MTTPANLIQHLKALKNPTRQQQMLMDLADMPERSGADDRKLNALIRAELAARKAAEARAKVEGLLRTEDQKRKAIERKERAHRLIQRGLLFEAAGLGDWTAGELLGALIHVDHNNRGIFKREGDRKLEELEGAKS